MSENIVKTAQSARAARAGAGDCGAREPPCPPCPPCPHGPRHAATPPPRMQQLHPKKLFSTPVSKFTARRAPPSPNLARIRTCLEEFHSKAPAPVRARPKAASMEDLTPSKKAKKDSDSNVKQAPLVRSPRRLGVSEAQAATRIARFMLLAAWRRRKDEVLNLRRTLESKRSSSERLRVQVWVLKSLLESDNAKVVLAMRELERLKQLLRTKDLEKAVLEREKHALEKDVSAAEDRASELNIGWRNSRNEVEAARGNLARSERERAAERAARDEARAQRDRAYTRINLLEEELSQHEALLTDTQAELATLRREAEAREQALKLTAERLRIEQEARVRCSQECSLLAARSSLAACEVAELRARLAQREEELRRAQEQLAWWPRPLTRMLGAARSWFRHPMSLPEAVMWSLIPARHGC